MKFWKVAAATAAGTGLALLAYWQFRYKPRQRAAAAHEVPRVPPKILVLGHSGHGKDEVADILRNQHGLRTCSSSRFALQTVIWPAVKDRYETPEAAFQDRHAHRALWFQLITEYNTPNKARLASELLIDHDVYVGLRNADELAAARPLFDLVVWVDASKRVGPEDESSCTVSPLDANVVLDNNGPLEALPAEVAKIFFHY